MVDTETTKPDEAQRRIAAVVEATGISKELIHHYLRQAILPKPEARALYSDQQVRLLRLIRHLRESHNLPLEDIRRLFEAFDFQPERLEPLTLGESLGNRIKRFVADDEIIAAEVLSTDDLIAATGITSARLETYLDARLITPLAGDAGPRFSPYDAHVVALCECGVALGIPFESFRTIASFTRIGFGTEHGAFFNLPERFAQDGPERLIPGLFLRLEIARSFIQAVLLGLTGRRLQELSQQPRGRAGLEAVIFRPSAVFVRRYALQARIDQAHDQLRGAASDPDSWLQMARLQLHAGRLDEARFFLEESLERWPQSPSHRSLLGQVLLIAGDVERGIEILSRLAGQRDALASTYLALGLHLGSRTESAASDDERAEKLMTRALPVLDAVESALSQIDTVTSDAAAESRMICGWLLVRLSPLAHTYERGLRLLAETCAALARRSLPADGLPGRGEALRLNCAYLLFDALAPSPSRDSASPPADLDLPAREELAALVCRLDPGCAFSEAVYLAADEGDR